MKLQWGHGISAVESIGPVFLSSRQRTGFNGATAFLPWNRFEALVLIVRDVWLQWGHGISAVESICTADIHTRRTSFNGATAFLPWNPRQAL